MTIAAQLPELDELDVRVVVDNETDTLSSVAEGIPQVPEAIQLAMQLPAVPSSRPTRRTCSAAAFPTAAAPFRA